MLEERRKKSKRKFISRARDIFSSFLDRFRCLDVSYFFHSHVEQNYTKKHPLSYLSLSLRDTYVNFLTTKTEVYFFKFCPVTPPLIIKAK